ncbi:hypothetical protein FQZ97_783400 [compost metagenome]
MLGVEDLAGAFVDLQRDADGALLQQVVEMTAQHGQQAVTDLLVHGRAAPGSHAQVGVEEAVLTLAIRYRRMGGRIGEDARAAGGEYLAASFVALLQHAVGQGAAQAADVRLAFEIRGVEQDQMGHGAAPQRRLVEVTPAGLEACAAGMAEPSCGVTGNTALIWPVPEEPK